jgi:hypothetical protein
MVSGQGNHGGRRRRWPMLAIPGGEAVGVGRVGRRRGVEPIWGVGEREAHQKGWFHGGVSEQRGNGDGRPEKRWGPPMRWPASSKTSMQCWSRWRLGWRTADVARRRGSFWWRFRTLAVGSGRATTALDRVLTAVLGQQWGGEPRIGQAREARGGFGPRPDRGGRFNGMAQAWRARPQLGTRWATPPDKRARHRPQSH